MRWATVMLGASALVLGLAAPGWAQSEDTRPATTTFWGDTGLWFVPTGEVLPNRDFSLSIQRTEMDFRHGNTNVSFWPVTGAVGIGRVELFGALRVVTSVDRDTNPLLFGDPADEAGGLVNEYPTVRESWTGNRLGDLFVGTKINLASQERQQPMALAIRATLKLPTADSDVGAGTGEYDGFVDLVGSREYNSVELAAFGGVAMRGDPGDVRLSDGFRWGGGAGFPTRGPLRASAEVYGEWAFNDAVEAPAGLLVGTDGSLSPALSHLKEQVTTALGVTWQHPSGVLLGAAASYRFGMDADDVVGQGASRSRDGFGVDFRIGFHRGVKMFAPPAPVMPDPAPAPAPVAAAPEPPPAPAPTPNRTPTVRAVCEPCTVESGRSVKLSARLDDPDGDNVTVRWSASGGTLKDTRSDSTEWQAETAPGLIKFTVTAEDSRGAVASDTVTVEVTSAAVMEFNDVLFDFDSSTLRKEALPTLQPAIAALKQHPQMRVEVEGHTCSIGTEDYNRALGERRAAAVRQYLVQQGIEADRITVVTYGEDRPSHDNATDTSRQLNRRGALVVRAMTTTEKH